MQMRMRMSRLHRTTISQGNACMDCIHAFILSDEARSLRSSLSHAADAPPLTSAPIITRADIKTKLYEILAKVDVTVVSERQIREMVSTELNGLDMKQHKDFVRKHCMHVVTFMQEPGAVMSDLQPLDDNEEDEVKKEGKEEDGEKASKRKKVQGKKRKGEEEDGDWEEDVDKMKKGSSKKKRPRKESSSSLKASVEDVEKDQRGEEDEEGDEDEERGSLKGPRAKPSVSKAPREKKPRKARSSAAAAAVEKMDQPGGLGGNISYRVLSSFSETAPSHHHPLTPPLISLIPFIHFIPLLIYS